MAISKICVDESKLPFQCLFLKGTDGTFVAA